MTEKFKLGSKTGVDSTPTAHDPTPQDYAVDDEPVTTKARHIMAKTIAQRTLDRKSKSKKFIVVPGFGAFPDHNASYEERTAALKSLAKHFRGIRRERARRAVASIKEANRTHGERVRAFHEFLKGLER